MEYKIDDVAKLFETTSFTIYSYITKCPDLRKTLKAKNGVLTINDNGIEILQKCIRGEIPIERNEKDFRDPDIYVESDPNIRVLGQETEVPARAERRERPAEPEYIPRSKKNQERSFPAEEPAPRPRRKMSGEPLETAPAPEPEEAPVQESRQYTSVGEFQKKVPRPEPRNTTGMNDLTYREMKETILYLREQLDKKDKQIEDLSRLLENNQILIKQEQLNFRSLEQYLTGRR